MIRDLSETLRALLDSQTHKSSFPELTAAQVVFEPPVDSFNPSQTSLNLFLYDIRENTQLRSNEPTMTLQDGKAVFHRPPLRIACSYLITAWPVGGPELSLQEHELLGQALLVLAQYPTIPTEFLQGRLNGQTPPLPMMVAKSEGLKDPSEFWSALGNKLRPSITVTVTISLTIAAPMPEEAFLVKTHDVRLKQR